MHKPTTRVMQLAAEAAMGYFPPVVRRDGVWYLAYKHGPAICCGDERHMEAVKATMMRYAQFYKAPNGQECRHKLPIWC